MKRYISFYYLLLALVIIGQFISILSIKTISVQAATARSKNQQEIAILQEKKQLLEGELNQLESLSQTVTPEGYTPISNPIALSQAESLLASR